ncbi:hypothetical protein P153DRAFT_357271 [Dothidotthia symphoricarpi CBS 119687]|uniref:Uncharacterized protein n=1 Tax=Dothidotthia symphoricarpi CBS 119687 TaxID=1392245 RepID=A0A6A6AAZ6_9PLEO|nr:uncharacterized protein P153DRAFT_357271 [Dothidotthia symphoricarpi CBS 119687]KAF2128746.1 hypothetical protein P153DRAFT_357271 [Dothidotthia symphoricarpi CBS 119687]
MKFLALAAAFTIPALAMPEPVSGGLSLATRDAVKLNQYRTMDDCRNDRNILYHAAPVSGTCYNIDGQTGAFFINTGGFLASKPQVSVTRCRGDYATNNDSNLITVPDNTYKFLVAKVTLFGDATA